MRHGLFPYYCVLETLPPPYPTDELPSQMIKIKHQNCNCFFFLFLNPLLSRIKDLLMSISE